MLKGLRALDLPFLVWLVVGGSIAACLVDYSLLGFSFKGYIWFVTLGVALMVVLRESKRICLPLWIWVPWGALLLTYLLATPYPNAIQRTAMMLCPVVVGAAVSTFPVENNVLRDFLSLCRLGAMALLVGSAVLAGVFTLGALPSVTGLAPQVMTGTMFANLFAAEFVEKKAKALCYWIGMAFLPVMAVTRTAIVAAALTLPLTGARLGVRKRAIILFVLAVAGLAVFYTTRVQQKMFYSGQGTLVDLSLDNPDFRTTGRLNMWQYLKEGIQEEPWFGHGANAQEWELYELFGSAAQPHNDWIRLAYDYGYVGAAVFGLCMLLQSLHALRLGRKSAGDAEILFAAGSSAFISFALFMLTDNIILYVAYFGNLHFTILGLAYSARREEKRAGLQCRRWKAPELPRARVAPGAGL